MSVVQSPIQVIRAPELYIQPSNSQWRSFTEAAHNCNCITQFRRASMNKVYNIYVRPAFSHINYTHITLAKTIQATRPLHFGHQISGIATNYCYYYYILAGIGVQLITIPHTKVARRWDDILGHPISTAVSFTWRSNRPTRLKDEARVLCV